MAKSSIHIKPVSGNSEAHNRRESKLDYVRADLSHQNYSFEIENIADRLAKIKSDHKKKTGRKLQKNATPIREGVFLFKADHTPKQMWEAMKEIEREFGVRPFQLHVHRDEGHRDPITQEWKPNYHAHVLFDWTDKETGRMIRLKKHDMAKMQTILANSLGMERGQSSDINHLNAVEFKTQKERENAIKLQNIAKEKADKLNGYIDRINGIKSVSVERRKITPAGVLNYKTANKENQQLFDDLVAELRKEKEKNQLKHYDNRDKNEIIKDYNTRIDHHRQMTHQEKKRADRLEQKKKTVDKAIVSFLNGDKKPLKDYIDNNPKAMEKALKSLEMEKARDRAKDRSRGFGR